MGAGCNRHFGIESRKVVDGPSVYLVSAAIGSGDAPSHAWADFSTTYSTVALCAAAEGPKFSKFMTLLADTDLSGDPGKNLIMAYIKYAYGSATWDAIAALGESESVAMLMLLKAKADTGLVNL